MSQIQIERKKAQLKRRNARKSVSGVKLAAKQASLTMNEAETLVLDIVKKYGRFFDLKTRSILKSQLGNTATHLLRFTK